MGTGRNIIVIGTSAGGLEALDRLISQLPTDIPAAIFIIQHMSPQNTGEALLHRLEKYKAFQCALAVNEEKFVEGRIYIGQSDYHLLLKKGHLLLVTKGARENRYRPAIDPLFRSAAATYGTRVIGVILTGMLDDGTAGLIAIKNCGGVTVVQNPKDAAYPDMPQNALNNLKVDHCVAISEMGAILDSLARERHGESKTIPDDVKVEAIIAERVLSDVEQVGGLGPQVPYNCPNCGGVLWQVDVSGMHRYRCHTGHSFTAAALLTSQTEKIEETLWISMRMFEERKNLLNAMAKTEIRPTVKRSYAAQANGTEVHIQRIRAMLMSAQPHLGDD